MGADATGASRIETPPVSAGAGGDNVAAIGLPALGAALAVVCLSYALRAGKRQRIVANLPTSKTTGVFMGLVEVSGTAEAEAPLVSHLTESRCVCYRWQIEEGWSRVVAGAETDGAGPTRPRTRTQSGWTTIAEGGEEVSFFLQDDCGVVRVQPAGATLELQTVLSRTCGRADPLYFGKGPPKELPDSDHRRRFVERAIPLHAEVFVVGQARERRDVVAAEIAADGSAPLFLISTRSRQRVSRWFTAGFRLLGALGLALAVAGFVVRDVTSHCEPALDTPVFLLAGTGYLLAWLAGWAWMVYNSLIELRQRVKQGWANVDVQLSRRHDLIPNLVGIVSGLRGHERTTQPELAMLRVQLASTPAGQPGPDPAGCLPALRAAAEAYPELKADASFLRLQQQLTESEQRIALAHSYFNEIATFYNTRIQVVPERLVARLVGMRPQPLIRAADFERAPMAVNLAK